MTFWVTYIPANLHLLCVCHTPKDQKLWSQAHRTISHEWHTINILFQNNTNKYVRHDLRYKGDLSTMSQYLSMVILPRYGWSQARSHQDLFDVSLPYSLVTLGNLGIFVNFWKSIEHHRQSSNFFRQSGNMDTKITCMPLSKSWELHNKEVKRLHVPR